VFRIGWFSTGRDEAARELLKTVQRNIARGRIKAEIAFAFSNREPGEARESDLFFELVREHRIPLICFSYKKFRARRGDGAPLSWRQEYDREVMRHLEGFHPDLCVLAGYMLIVGEEMCREYPMINLHPATPGGPAGTWQEVIWRLIESRAQEAGAMMHVVTPELDKGPPATYCTFSLRGEPFDRHWGEMEGRPIESVKSQRGEKAPLFRLIRRYELVREFPLIVATLKGFAEGRIRIELGKIVDAGGRPIDGYDLSAEIDEMLKREP
jgi:folate-dependent phosphoribosylglycinamide formyltransferase PurN